MEVGARLIVKGAVQGVGFRYFVYRRATRLDLQAIAEISTMEMSRLRWRERVL